MFTKTKLQNLFFILAVTLLMIVAPSPANAALNTLNNNRVTKFWVNGLSAHVFVEDKTVGGGGFVFFGEDQIKNTLWMDFSFAVPHPTDPDYVYVFQGSGEIPNMSATFTSSSAHLSVTTPESYPVYLCVLNVVTGYYTCSPHDPLTFNLTWVGDGFGSVYEKTKRIETYGPLSIKYDAEFASHTASVSGTFGDYSGSNMNGTLYDTKNKSFLREVTLQLNP